MTTRRPSRIELTEEEEQLLQSALDAYREVLDDPSEHNEAEYRDRLARLKDVLSKHEHV